MQYKLIGQKYPYISTITANMNCNTEPEGNILIFIQIIISWNLPAFEKKTHTRTGRHSRKLCFKKLTTDVSRIENNFNELI